MPFKLSIISVYKVVYQSKKKSEIKPLKVILGMWGCTGIEISFVIETPFRRAVGHEPGDQLRRPH